MRTVSGDEDGMRLDRWFKTHYPQLPHTRLQKLLRTGQVRVDGKRVKAGMRVEEGQQIRVPPLPEPQEKKPTRLSGKDREFVQGLVIHKDDSLIVLNKPPGLAVQGGSKTTRHIDGFLDGLKFRKSERPRLVHRLDKDTSGVLVLARTRQVAAKLGKVFKEKRMEKLYWAVVMGCPRPSEGIIDMPVGKSGGLGKEKVQAHAVDAKRAVTEYIVNENAGGKAAFVALMPETGRTHQLRVHMAAIGCPVLGDGKYGGRDAFIGGLSSKLHLHACQITMPHPDGGRFTITADLPPHMAETWRKLGFEA